MAANTKVKVKHELEDYKTIMIQMMREEREGGGRKIVADAGDRQKARTHGLPAFRASPLFRSEVASNVAFRGAPVGREGEREGFSLGMADRPIGHAGKHVLIAPLRSVALRFAPQLKHPFAAGRPPAI